MLSVEMFTEFNYFRLSLSFNVVARLDFLKNYIYLFTYLFLFYAVFNILHCCIF